MNLMLAPVALSLMLAAQPPAAQPAAPLPPAEAAARMTLPPGFRATLFAGEPDLVQPIAFTFDDRGRLWAVESYTYPNWVRQGEGKDRVLIFEDTDGDGRFDTRTVFLDKGMNLSGIAVGFGGVWLLGSPAMTFVPDRDGDDRPDGPAEVVLDGWSLDAKHNVPSSLTWGPDGWLYGCNGILATSRLGRPGTPDAARTPMNCGVWRFHPTRRTFEVVAHGTTNPWGLDFDDYGEMFITNCVIKHLWHVVPGAHFERMFGQDFNPHLYRLLESCADHIHWGGGHWTESRGGAGAHDAPGGGHAHAGCMVYLGDNWPSEYRNSVLMGNIHGSRLNRDTLVRQGSGYVARHAPDFLLAHDPWFRPLAVHQGPDGSVFVSDWCDTGECHDYDKVHLSGRIFKVSYGRPAPYREDLARLPDKELVQRQLSRNDWQVRRARRLLQERAAAGKLSPEVRPALVAMLRGRHDVTRQLRALWALYVTGGLDEAMLGECLASERDEVRAWAVRLAVDGDRPSAAVRARLAEMARRDAAPRVRLALASALQRLPAAERWPVAEALAARSEDANDPLVTLMTWYGVEPLAAADPERFLALAGTAKASLLRQHVARRTAAREGADLPGLGQVVRRLGETADQAEQADLLAGVRAALAGRREVPLPQGWPDVAAKLRASPHAEVRGPATLLAVQFGDPEALASLRRTLTDAAAPLPARTEALQALLTRQSPDLVPVLFDLLGDPGLRLLVLRGLAAYADPDTPRRILALYTSLSDVEKAETVATLASRPPYALALLDAVEKGTIPRRDVSVFLVRQMQGFKDARVTAAVARAWGSLRATSSEKAALMARYKSLLAADALKKADPVRGHAVFTKTCASCHVLFGEGAKIGPELTGSQRTNLEYVLENVLDPSAVVPREYQVARLELKNGRVLTGIVTREDEKVVAVQTPTEAVLVPRGEIEERGTLPQSLMPEGLLDPLSPDEVRDLVAYLAGPGLPRK